MLCFSAVSLIIVFVRMCLLADIFMLFTDNVVYSTYLSLFNHPIHANFESNNNAK
jgi:hypothetical protein